MYAAMPILMVPYPRYSLATCGNIIHLNVWAPCTLSSRATATAPRGLVLKMTRPGSVELGCANSPALMSASPVPNLNRLLPMVRTETTSSGSWPFHTWAPNTISLYAPLYGISLPSLFSDKTL